VERSIEVNSIHGDSSELSPGLHRKIRYGNEKAFGKSFAGETTRTTEIRGGGISDDPPRLEKGWGNSEGRDFMFFADTDEEEIELTHSPRRIHGVLY
jgi:hypothetical protein